MSTLKTNKITTTAGVEVYTAKAWVNFNGTGAVAIRAAGNVSSITDNGTGDYTVNFTTAMEDANYSVSGFLNASGNTARSPVLNFQRTDAGAGDLPSTASVRTCIVSGSTATVDGGRFDTTNICVSIFR
jgi:hypothetical protein